MFLTQRADHRRGTFQKTYTTALCECFLHVLETVTRKRGLMSLGL